MDMRRLSPRELRRLTQRMGLKIEELGGVEEVVIKLADRNLVIKEARVSVLDLKGEKIFQVMGSVQEVPREEAKVEEQLFTEEDVQLVAVQAGVSPEEARRALEEAGGDLAQAIILLSARKGAG